MREDIVKKGLKALVAPTPSNLLDAGLAVLPESQTSKANKDFQDALDEATLDTERGTRETNDRIAQLQQHVSEIHGLVSAKYQTDGPTMSDVADMLMRLGQEYPRAGHNGKRRILLRAFFSSFDPEYYNSGMSRHLWSIAREIEYPEASFLARKLREIPERMAGRRFQVPKETTDTYLANKLVRLELLAGRAPDYYTTAIAYKFIEFIWSTDEDEFE